MKFYIPYGYTQFGYFSDRDGAKCQAFKTIHGIWGTINERGNITIKDRDSYSVLKSYVNGGLYVEVQPLWPHYQIIIPE
jgi:hypothetical protein